MKTPTPASEPWPRVSVVIPTYNRAALVAEAIVSALAQDYPHLEVLVVDDGSTDGTKEVVERFGPPVRYVFQDNAGAAAARNRGIEQAVGEWIAFLDSDDLFLPGKLRTQVRALGSEPDAVLAYCWYDIVDAEGRSRPGRRCCLSGQAADRLLARCMQGPLATPTVIARRDALLRAGGFDVGMTLSEDIDLWCRLACLGSITLVPQTLVRVRRHAGNVSRELRRRRHLAASLRILDKAFARPPQRAGWWRASLYAKAHLWSWLSEVGSRLPAGLSFWLRALLTHPAATLTGRSGRSQRPVDPALDGISPANLHNRAASFSKSALGRSVGR